MVAVKERKNDYVSSFSRFEERLSADARPLRRLRKAAIERFGALGFPTLKDEEWRFTNLAPLTSMTFEPAAPDGVPQATKLPVGVLVCGLAEALVRHPALVEPYLARLADYESHAFTALNTAFLRDGAFVHISAGTVVEEPINLAFVARASERPLVWHQRCLIVAGPNSKASIVESYDGSESVYFTNAVTEVAVGAEAFAGDAVTCRCAGADGASWSSIAMPPRASGSRSARSTTRSMMPSVSARSRRSMSRATSIM